MYADLIGLDLDLVARGQERVEAHDQVWVSFEQVGHSINHSRGVDSVNNNNNNLWNFMIPKDINKLAFITIVCDLKTNKLISDSHTWD